MLTQQNNNKNQQINHPQIPDFNIFFGNRRGLNVCSGGANRRSPTPDCPSFEHLERKQKKPIMERKRRARLNACFERLKEILLTSDSQQSKLEKADVLERTVIFVGHLQQQLRSVQQNLNQLLVGTENGHQFQKGVSIAIATTNELLAGLQPELCKRVQLEVPERILRALGVSSPNNSNLFASNNLIPTSIQQQNNNKLINPSLISNVNQQKYTNNYFINPINNISNKNNIFPNNTPPIPPATCYRFPSTLNLFPLQQQNSFLNYYYPSNYVINNVGNSGIKKVAPSKEINNKEENEEDEEQVVDVESLINEEEERKEEESLEEDKNKEVNSDSLKMRRRNISRKTVWRPY
ncbi:unnamed protein product [Meloidogyne enterolobii]|uniref:Uncharacterized protein n=1 Tax=Meloidogyne enterolobii TaxID=390850 RepID=A0ACB1B347_MELEN